MKVVMNPDRGLQLPACPANLRVKSRVTCCGLALGSGSAAGRRQSSVGELSRWLFAAQLRSLLGHLEPRNLFSAGVRAAGGGRAGDRSRPGAAGDSQPPGAAASGRVGASVYARRAPTGLASRGGTVEGSGQAYTSERLCFVPPEGETWAWGL